MSLARADELVAAALDAGCGVGAFNVITIEHAEGIAAGAELAKAPAILQISQNAVTYHLGKVEPLAAACALIAEAADVPIALHLDHVNDLGLLHRAADAGFGSVMYDASRLPYPDNVAATRSAAVWAHEHGLWLEAELGEIGGKDGVHSPTARTRPDEAAAYVTATSVDALAVAVGSSHAMTAKSARLDIPLIRELHATVPVPLVLHGSSGVLDEDLLRGVVAGLTKINIGTQLNVAFTHAVREALTDATVTDPRRYLRPAADSVTQTVAAILSTLGACRTSARA